MIIDSRKPETLPELDRLYREKISEDSFARTSEEEW